MKACEEFLSKAPSNYNTDPEAFRDGWREAIKHLETAVDACMTVDDVISLIERELGSNTDTTDTKLTCPVCQKLLKLINPIQTGEYVCDNDDCQLNTGTNAMIYNEFYGTTQAEINKQGN